MPTQFRSTLPTSSTNSRLPISSAVFDRICDASSDRTHWFYFAFLPSAELRKAIAATDYLLNPYQRVPVLISINTNDILDRLRLYWSGLFDHDDRV
ncbi:hypothetical protein PGT21_010967 [Puccinia graminis f. sp. tritici]|uniref:Uncharacterized protein n=1 Tax=Puccinia graminis f. sp. tritici TaxID=56615 RepID=A0A5B0MMH5_PUCGR|nr:hypothetical protein PGT21_010967 [Puccinia graminis f. sp. tritici]